MAEHSLRLPSFDEMQTMAREQPEALENLRRRLTEEVIRNAPQRGKRRLQGLAFTIDAERRRARNPLQACIKLSQMMFDSAVELQACMDLLRTGVTTQEVREADVIPFARPRPKA